MHDIIVRSVSDSDDLKQIEAIQRLTWGMDDVEIIPGRFLHAVQYNGNCLLGAYDDGRLVGFVLGILATVEAPPERPDRVAASRLQLYSAIMGVLPEFQSSGVGYRLKLAQREFALRLGVRLVTWTFDPLESRNGFFNVAKLGVVCHRYLRDFHGPMSGINAGLPSDRFNVEWWVTSNRVKTRLSRERRPLKLGAFLAAGATLINPAGLNRQGLPTPAAEPNLSDDRILLLEIPPRFQELKAADMALAQAWRLHCRDLFERYFGRNYLLTDFVRHEDEDGRARSYYVLAFGDS
ncbi:MAG: hypothetical protein ACRDHL_04040 [Candidatus Promineifilaceae bacterium]